MKNNKTQEKNISLYPLKFEEAVKQILSVKPETIKKLRSKKDQLMKN